MNIILGIWNRGGRGKSSTLREFADIVLINYPACKILYEHRYFNYKTDFILLIQIDNKIIGIASKGDPGTGLKEKLDMLIKEYKSNIVLCTTRSSGETVDAVISFKGTHQVIWSSTYETEDASQHKFLNQTKASHILDLLKQLKAI